MNSFQPLGVTYGGTYPNRSVSTNNTPVETHWINDEYDWRKSNIKWYFNDERRFAMRALLGFRWYFSFLSNSKSMTFEWEDSKKSKPTLIIPAIYIFWILNSKVTSQMAFGVKSSNLCQHKKKKKQWEYVRHMNWLPLTVGEFMFSFGSVEWNPYHRNHILWHKSNDRCHSNKNTLRKHLKVKTAHIRMQTPSSFNVGNDCRISMHKRAWKKEHVTL